MKTWTELTEEQQQKALDIRLKDLLCEVVEGSLRFRDDEDTLQGDIDKAIDKANKMQTPWFASEYIMDSVGNQLRDCVKSECEDAYFIEARDPVIVFGVC